MSTAKNYVIWPILISLCAVVLSQIKPLYVYFENPKVDILVGKNINFYEGWGNIGANLFIQLVNTGDASGTVEKIDVFASANDSDYAHILKAQSYYLQPESVGKNDIISQIPFSYVTVNGNSVWTGFVNSYADFSKSKQKKIQDFTQSVDEDLNSKWIKNGPAPTIEEELLSEILNFTRDNLKDIEIGEYQLLIMAWMQGDSVPSIRKAYSYSIYDTDKARLSRKEKEYPYGGGIIYPIPQGKTQQMGFNATITEVTENAVVEKLYNAYKKERL